MGRIPGKSFGLAIAWMLLPIVPALLGSTYHQTINFEFSGERPDPREWRWFAWVVLTGPLLGYGFLAGATLTLTDDPGRRGPRSWLARRSVWVTVGPWVGFLFWMSVFHAIGPVTAGLNRLYPPSQEWRVLSSPFWQETRVGRLLGLGLMIAGIGSLAYGWLLVAIAAIRRARRLDRLRQALRHGLATAFGFVASLFGSFWTINEAWRSYFFDPTILPILIALICAAMTSGCAASVTAGEVRRRELFEAMLMAWLLGLALLWRWWSRPRSKPPDPPSAGRNP
jgi:hypothetical protein